MTVLFADSFEGGTLSGSWSESNPGHNYALITTGTAYDGSHYLSLVRSETLSVGFAWPANNLIAVQVAFRQDVAGTPRACALLDGAGSVIAAVGSSNGDTFAPNLAGGAYHLVQLVYSKATTPATVQCWIDGVSAGSVSVSSPPNAASFALGEAAAALSSNSFDTVVVQDQSFYAVQYAKTLSATLQGTGSVTRTGVHARALAATLNLGVSLLRNRVFAKTLAATGQLTGSIVRSRLLPKAVTATLQLTAGLVAKRAKVFATVTATTTTLNVAQHLSRSFAVVSPTTTTLSQQIARVRTYAATLQLTPALLAPKLVNTVFAATFQLTATFGPRVLTRAVGMTARLLPAPAIGITKHLSATLSARLQTTAQISITRVVVFAETIALHDALPVLPSLPVIRQLLQTRVARKLLHLRSPGQRQ